MRWAERGDVLSPATFDESHEDDMSSTTRPLVRAALDALRCQVEPQRVLRRKLVELDEALAAGDRACGQATGMGALRAGDDNLRRFDVLLPFCSTCQFTMRIPADPAAIPIVTDGVAELMERKQWAKEDVFAVQLALQEAVANAIRHGCRGDVSKHVQCSVSCDESDEVVLVVRDPGSGFTPGTIEDPLETANILKPSGRGVFLMNELMDDVRFADGGREVQMPKRKRSGLTPVSG